MSTGLTLASALVRRRQQAEVPLRTLRTANAVRFAWLVLVKVPQLVASHAARLASLRLKIPYRHDRPGWRDTHTQMGKRARKVKCTHAHTMHNYARTHICARART